jgi:hypothetical protein
MPRGHINEHLHTTLANSGRAAGAGISYDKYDDESGYRPGPRDTGRIRFPSDGQKADELNGPVIVVKPAKSANTTQII